VFQDLQTKKMIGEEHERDGLYYLRCEHNLSWVWGYYLIVFASSVAFPVRPCFSESNKLYLTTRSVSKLECASYQLGKHLSFTFVSRNINCCKPSFEVIRTDIWGPTYGLKLFHAIHILLLLLMIFMYDLVVFIEDIYEVLYMFKPFHKEILNQFDCFVKVLRSDNSPEYMQFVFQKYCASFGIIHQIICAHTPQ